MAVQVAGIEFYFSYQTLVAIHTDGLLMMRENEWGPTTGKHMKWIKDDVGSQLKMFLEVNADEFTARLYNILSTKGLTRCKTFPKYLHALETGEFIDKNIPKESARTFGRSLERNIAKKKAQAVKQVNRALDKEKARVAKQRREEQQAKRKQQRMLKGIIGVELLEEML